MRHKRLLLTALVGLHSMVNTHREICHEWTYTPKLKGWLTNSRKALEDCINKFDFQLNEKDKRNINNKLDEYDRIKGRIKINSDDKMVNMEEFKKVLPEEFVEQIIIISKVKNYVDDELKKTIQDNCKEEYRRFSMWYDKYEKFLEEEIFI